MPLNWRWAAAEVGKWPAEGGRRQVAAWQRGFETGQHNYS